MATSLYDAAGQLLTSTVQGVTTSYTYDLRGNLTQVSDGTSTTLYGWDAMDRLASVLLPDSTAIAYTYDADGQRVQQDVAGDVTNFLWDAESVYGDVVLEYDVTGTPLVDYVLGGTRPISQHQAGVTSYFHADGQGSTRVLTDAAGSVTDSYTYSAFGELSASSGAAPNKYLYTGQQFDVATGQYSLRARYYGVDTGRFLSRDTYSYMLSSPAELNRYQYVNANPINLADPSGYAAITEAGLDITRPISNTRETVITGKLIADLVDTILGLLRLLQFLSLLQETASTGNGDNNNGDLAYRNPHPSEHPNALKEGFYAKNPDANYHVAYHITSGSRAATQYISLTRSLEVAQREQVPGLPIYIINLKEVVGLVIDLTDQATQDRYLSEKHVLARNFSTYSQEVLVVGWIPPTAIKGLIP